MISPSINKGILLGRVRPEEQSLSGLATPLHSEPDGNIAADKTTDGTPNGASRPKLNWYSPKQRLGADDFNWTTDVIPSTTEEHD